MGDGYRQLSQHRQRARRAVWHERERDYLSAAEAWLLVARQSPEIMWQRWALLRATLCQQRAEEKNSLPETSVPPRRVRHPDNPPFDMS